MNKKRNILDAAQNYHNILPNTGIFYLGNFIVSNSVSNLGHFFTDPDPTEIIIRIQIRIHIRFLLIFKKISPNMFVSDKEKRKTVSTAIKDRENSYTE